MRKEEITEEIPVVILEAEKPITERRIDNTASFELDDQELSLAEAFESIGFTFKKNYRSLLDSRNRRPGVIEAYSVSSLYQAEFSDDFSTIVVAFTIFRNYRHGGLFNAAIWIDGKKVLFNNDWNFAEFQSQIEEAYSRVRIKNDKMAEFKRKMKTIATNWKFGNY